MKLVQLGEEERSGRGNSQCNGPEAGPVMMWAGPGRDSGCKKRDNNLRSILQTEVRGLADTSNGEERVKEEGGRETRVSGSQADSLSIQVPDCHRAQPFAKSLQLRANCQGPESVVGWSVVPSPSLCTPISPESPQHPALG